MRWDRLPNPWIHALLAVIFALLMMAFTYERPSFREGSMLFSAVLRWPEWPAASARRLFSAGFSWLADQEELLRVNRKLRLENLELRGMVEEAKGLPDKVSGDLRQGRVTYRPPDRWWQEIRVDLGLRDGVRPGDAVLSEGFLVGRVQRVADHESWVELLSSSTLLIPVVVDSTRDLGVVTGTGDGRVQLLYIPPERDLESGMTLSTALVSERLQPGIPLGKIERREAAQGGFSPYSVTLGADLSRLYSVSLFVRQRGEGP